MAADGPFRFICTHASLALCTLINAHDNSKPDGKVDSSNSSSSSSSGGAMPLVTAIGIFPVCSARAVLVANTIVFQLASALANVVAAAMLVVVLANVRTKYTAVARQEMLDLFALCLALTLVSLVIDTGLVPAAGGWRRAYIYGVALQLALQSACCWCLMFNGIVVFQLWEDGTCKSVWTLRGSCALMALTTFLVVALTFDAGVISSTLPLFILVFVANALYLVIYATSQIVLTVFVLEDMWALGATLLGAAVFVVGQTALYGLSRMICVLARHFLDGLFVASLCNMFALIMVYKYWDMITTEDLEFSVNNRETSPWESKSTIERAYDQGNSLPLMQVRPEDNLGVVSATSSQAGFKRPLHIDFQSDSSLYHPGPLSSQFRPPY